MRLATVTTRKLRILDFDVECRPLAWYGGDFVTKQPTAIAWKFIGTRGAPSVALLGESGDPEMLAEEEEDMIEQFLGAYDEADIVTGHYIRGFDLPLLNGALMRLGMVGLPDKLAHDTKSDLVKAQGISKSLENLGAMFELKHPKIQMNTTKWATANMLTRAGMEEARKRCVGDVVEHIELRSLMVERDLLRAPALWSGTSSGSSPSYAP